MKYFYDIEIKDLEDAFGELFDYEEIERVPGKVLLKLKRAAQDRDRTYNVNITTLQHALILMDYLSTDQSDWDYHPKLNINFGTFAGVRKISFQARGNWDHKLDLNDTLIVDKRIKAALDSGLIRGFTKY